MYLPILICLLLSISLASANTEKTIFLGPEPVNIPQHSPTLSDLNIDVLTPEDWSLRSRLDAIFPTQKLPRGKEAWLLLDSLTEGQRYEIRVCWLATVRCVYAPAPPPFSPFLHLCLFFPYPPSNFIYL